MPFIYCRVLILYFNQAVYKDTCVLYAGLITSNLPVGI